MFSNIVSQISEIHLVPPTTTSRASGPTAKTNSKKHDGSASTAEHQPTLLITSYDRFTPPHPRPDLEYDCRNTPNPERGMRMTNTGINEDLQSHLLERDEFSEMLCRAEEEIHRLMEERRKLVERKARDNASMTIRIGCLCGSGHHRSVAFAECLEKMKWPENWRIEVEHRDLTDEVVEKKRQNKDRMGDQH